MWVMTSGASPWFGRNMKEPQDSGAPSERENLGGRGQGLAPFIPGYWLVAPLALNRKPKANLFKEY